MTVTQELITIGMCVLATLITRFLPFILFSGKKETPKFIQYLGKALPAAIFALLLVYCLKNVNLLGDVDFPFTADVKTRYKKNANRAFIEKIDSDTVKCTFTFPERAPCPGQSAVFYDGERVLGGGLII